MADQKPVFYMLEDSNGCGIGWDLVNEGDVLDVTVNAGAVFTFQDSSGNAVFPTLTADGKVPVSLDAAGTSDSGSAVVTPTALDTDTDVVTLTLTASADYVVQFFSGSGFKPMVWDVIHNNDGTPAELGRFVTGPGDFNHCCSPGCMEFTAGATGVQEIKLRAQQKFGALSDMHGTICVLEKA